MNGNEEVRSWCWTQGWRYVEGDSVTGSEDQCVVLLPGRNSEYLEPISRGRNLLVVVTTRGEG